MARMDPLKREDMNDEQAEAFDEVAASGGRLGGPNGIYIRVPELFRLHQGVGNYLRAGHLSPRQRQPAPMPGGHRPATRSRLASRARSSMR